jgi:hypothetical protein
VRETFVAVITSNLPMISPLIARCFRPLIGSLRTPSSTTNKASKSRRSAEGKARASMFENKDPRRGMGPRSVNPIPNFSVNCSDEHIYARPHEDPGTTSYETDLEAGQPLSKAGVIVKQTSVEIIEMRPTGDQAAEREVGDYYLVRQSQQDAERLAREAGSGKRKRSSASFIIGRAL